LQKEEKMTGSAGRSGGDRKTVGVDTTPEDSGPTKPNLPPKVSTKWDQLIEQLPKKSLRKIDCHELKLLAELLTMADQLSSAAIEDPTDHQTGRLFLNVCDRVHRLSASFGLNPGDRKRLSLDPGNDEPDAFKLWWDSREDRLNGVQ
jgi:hypothetical protein